MGKGLEYLTCKQKLRGLGLFSLGNQGDLHVYKCLVEDE